jgi:hypothetical protein
MAVETYHGSCHCGSVQFRARIDLDQPTTRCNCSICTKSRLWFTIIGDDAFEITTGRDALTDYRWVPPAQDAAFLHFMFCSQCGIRIHGWGDDASFGGKFHAVNLAALDDADAEVLAAAPISYVDGRHDRFTEPPADTRLM